MKRIAVVEDEVYMREELCNMLQKDGYLAEAITELEDAVRLLAALRPDLVILDLNLPEISGFQICQELKNKTAIPVLVLTSRDQVKDELQAFHLGADEYLTKPCRKDRLLARVSNILKRYEGRTNLIEGPDFLLDQQTYTLYIHNTSVVLPKNQGKLLVALLSGGDALVTTEQLCIALWGTTEYIDENALQVNLTRLKKTMSGLEMKQRIVAVRGMGYRLETGGGSMKRLWRMIERYYPWLLLLLGVDCFCAIILWISDIQAFQTLSGLVVLTSLLLFSAILFVLNKRETTRRELFRDFLSDPTICNEERLLSAISREEGESIRLLASVLQEHKTESNSMADALQDYEEYVEGWAHEAKTPLSLLTMLLDNRSNEMSPPLQAKLDYVRSQLQEDVTQMLYYARLKSSTKDYQFKDINLNDCLGEVLEDYAPLLEEKQFVIINKLQSETVYTDRRGLQFMLGQIVSNAIKYSSDSPMLTISMIHSEIADVLSVEDNGIGVKKYDLPYIFQKGFTGDSTDSRKKATGIGLYLVKKMADDLNLRLEAASPWEKGFKIVIFFPKLRSNGGK